LETVYEQCLCHELGETGIAFGRQVPIPVIYKGSPVGDGFKADIVVAGAVILELKAVAAILPIYEVQLRTYLRMSGIRVGLLLNFNVPRLVDGLRRYVVWPPPMRFALLRVHSVLRAVSVLKKTLKRTVPGGRVWLRSQPGVRDSNNDFAGHGVLFQKSTVNSLVTAERNSRNSAMREGWHVTT